MRKSMAEIHADFEQSASGVALVLLSIVGFLVMLWVLMAIVRVVMG